MMNWNMEEEESDKEAMPFKVKEAYDNLCDALNEAGMDEPSFFKNMSKGKEEYEDKAMPVEEGDKEQPEMEGKDAKKNMIMMILKKKKLGKYKEQEEM